MFSHNAACVRPVGIDPHLSIIRSQPFWLYLRVLSAFFGTFQISSNTFGVKIMPTITEKVRFSLRIMAEICQIQKENFGILIESKSGKVFQKILNGNVVSENISKIKPLPYPY